MKSLNDEDDFSLQMTPMIDIVFQLLIFFLLATTIAEEERDLNIALPEGSQGASLGSKARNRLVINVRTDGEVSLGGTNMDWNDLRIRLIEAGRKKDKPSVFLRGDKKAPYGKVAKVLQLCSEADLRKVQVEYRYEKGPGP